MIRGILLLLMIVLVYSAIRTVFRTARKAYHQEDARVRLKGEEMVLCPECGTYVVKGRAVTRRVGGKEVLFCGDSCARRQEEKNRG